MSPVEAMKRNLDLLAQDTAFLGCIEASRKAGATEAQQIIANGIAMIAWGLSVAAAKSDVSALQRDVIARVAELEPVRLREAA